MPALRRTVPVLLTLLSLITGSGCSKSSHRGFVTGGGSGELALQTVTTSLTFPTFLTSPPGDHTRLFVTEKGGTIRIIKNGVLLPTPFLDLHTLVSTGEEQGLLCLAFEPNYATTGRFLVSYTDVNNAVQIVRYKVSALSPDLAGPSPVGTILSLPKTLTEHNGGGMAFGPDGMLWIGMGDGGGYGDPLHQGQTKTDLFGSMLRIDVSGGTSGYAIPPGNPFASPNRPEVWDIGLRNPWRWSFDRATGDLYIGDVGQEHWEEINVAPASRNRDPGGNYGWPVLEGEECFMASDCDRTGKIDPVLFYGHGPGCAVTGGYVYRGTAIPALQGVYFYSDYCAHEIHAFRYVGGAATAETTYTALDPGANVSSFGEDASGELYILTDTGGVYRIVAH